MDNKNAGHPGNEIYRRLPRHLKDAVVAPSATSGNPDGGAGNPPPSGPVLGGTTDIILLFKDGTGLSFDGDQVGIFHFNTSFYKHKRRAYAIHFGATAYFVHNGIIQDLPVRMTREEFLNGGYLLSDITPAPRGQGVLNFFPGVV